MVLYRQDSLLVLDEERLEGLMEVDRFGADFGQPFLSTLYYTSPNRGRYVSTFLLCPDSRFSVYWVRNTFPHGSVLLYRLFNTDILVSISCLVFPGTYQRSTRIAYVVFSTRTDQTVPTGSHPFVRFVKRGPTQSFRQLLEEGLSEFSL